MIGELTSSLHHIRPVIVVEIEFLGCQHLLVVIARHERKYSDFKASRLLIPLLTSQRRNQKPHCCRS